MKIYCEECDGSGRYVTLLHYAEPCSLCDGKGYHETSNDGFVVRMTEPTNEAKDDSESYCGCCDDYLDNDDWHYCPSCGVKLIMPWDVEPTNKSETKIDDIIDWGE